MWVSTSYFVPALLNARCSSSFCKTFHVSWYQWCADLQIPSPRKTASVGSVEKWVRANDMHCTCARRTGLQLHGLFLGGTHSAIASQIYKRYEALTADRSRPQKKTVDPSPRSTATAVRTTLAYIGLLKSDGPCRFFKSTIYLYLWIKISVMPIISAIICVPIFTARWCHSARLSVRL